LVFHKPEMIPTIFTVILNTNRREDTLACLASLAETTYPANQTIVLDNASSDGSVPAIRAQFPEVQIIELEQNRGYAGNNNVGIQAVVEQGADWVLVLNEDTILASDCLSQLINVGQSDPAIGILGPMVYHHDEPNIIQSAGGHLGRFWYSSHLGQNELDRGQFSQPRDTEWISGCAILIRRAVIEQIGLLDERFFYYWEETEYCVRARRHGWQVVHVPQARLWHKGVQRDYSPAPSVTYYSTRNRFLLLAKHRASIFVWLVAWGQLLRTLTSWTLKPEYRGMAEHRRAMMQGAFDFLRRRWGMRAT
jgi:GT2 family glycosyltransferase